jgi:uncharacterized Ntn-hydrolase superfamily protein
VTYSLVARIGRDEWIVAVASRFPGVVSVVPHIAPNAGVVIYQALGNAPQAKTFLQSLVDGYGAEDILASAEGVAPFAEQQVVVLGSSGPPAVRSGPNCLPYFGCECSVDSPVVAIANLMRDDGVPLAMLHTWDALGPTVDPVLRAYECLQTGSSMGGDVRGDSSAVIIHIALGNVRMWNVVYSLDPIAQLSALVHDPQGGEIGSEHWPRITEYDVAYWQAVAAEARGELPEAISALESQLPSSPDDPQWPESHLYAGRLRILAGDMAGGTQLLQSLVTYMPHWRLYIDRVPARAWGDNPPLLVD